jgi:hypothetical protein
MFLSIGLGISLSNDYGKCKKNEQMHSPVEE